MPRPTIADFRDRLADRSLGAMPPRHTVGLAAAEYVRDHVNWDMMAELAAESRRFLPRVEQEIALLKSALTAQRERMHTRAFLFGIATPNRDERDSIGWALSAEHHYPYAAPAALVRRSYTSLRTGKQAKAGFYSSLTSTLYAAQMQCIDCADVSSLESIPGVGPKVARMIHAITHPHARVWTVDLWHMRQLLWACEIDWRCRIICNPAAYATLESIWLTYAEKFFPGVDIFTVQWSTWCAAEGQFLSHSALWADLVEVA